MLRGKDDGGGEEEEKNERISLCVQFFKQRQLEIMWVFKTAKNKCVFLLLIWSIFLWDSISRKLPNKERIEYEIGKGRCQSFVNMSIMSSYLSSILLLSLFLSLAPFFAWTFRQVLH